MNELMRIIMASAQDAAVKQGQSTVERIEHIVLFTIAAAVCGAAAVVSAMAAIWIYAIGFVGPVGAPLIVASLFATMSGVFLIVRRSAIRPRPASPAPDPVPAMLLAEATHLLKEHKGMTLLAAVLAGLELSRKEK